MVNFVHVAVHFDSTNLGSLSVERRLQLIDDQQRLVKDLRKRGVPTVWISFPKGHSSFELHDAGTSWPARNPRQRPKAQLSAAHFSGMDIRSDEPMLVIGSANSFEGGHLRKFIHEHYGPGEILQSGGTTTVCIPASAEGGIKDGFRVHIMADACYTTYDWDHDPQKHVESLEAWAKSKGLHTSEKLNITTTTRVLGDLPSSDGPRTSFRSAAHQDAQPVGMV